MTENTESAGAESTSPEVAKSLCFAQIFIFACLFASIFAGRFYYNELEINQLEYRRLQGQIYGHSDDEQYMSYLYKANEDGVITSSEFSELSDIASASNSEFFFAKEKASFNEIVKKESAKK